MSQLRDKAFEVVFRMSQLTAEQEVIAELRSAGAVFGYDNFFMTGLPASQAEHLKQHAMISGWPEEWLSRYADHGYVHVDPVIKKIRATTMPFMWHEAPYDKDDAAAARVMNESPSFGLVEGMTVPIHTFHGFQAGVCFSSKHRLAWLDDTRSALHFISIYAHAATSKIIDDRHGREPKPKARLSPREIECLKWSSAGKTSWEISVILGLSEHTVIQYL